MIPSGGPAPTDSRAETLVYYLLKEQLSEEFTVVHSLPWLSTAVREMGGATTVTGEIDFLIVHPELGVLAVEVKGGAHRVQGLAFVHVKSGRVTRAVEQVRRNTHGLARWLGVSPCLRLKIGYALVFPDSDFREEIVSTALVDVTAEPPESIVVDRRQMTRIGQRICEILSYWKKSLCNPPLGPARRDELLNTLCPSFDGTLAWGSRVVWDEQMWLRLTPEQSAVVDDVITGKRLVVAGWPGTGKTLVLIESAKRLLRQNKRVLVLTFNALLAQFIRDQIGVNQLLRVGTWHSICGSFASKSRDEDGKAGWLESGCLQDIQSAALKGRIQPFDALLIDEAQTFRGEWIEWLSEWHVDAQLIAFCDETQVFAFEEGRATLQQLCRLTGVERPFTLTAPLRSPRAVYQRLASVRKTDYQLHMPRELEADTLEELLVVGMIGAVLGVLKRLSDSGVSRSDVVLLDKYGWLGSGEESDLSCHTLSRFRGMESPVVIVCNAEQMDDAELFCAYSRATTLCIALYDAEVLGVHGANCLFQAMVMAEPGQQELAESARINAQTDELVRANLEPIWFGLQSLELGWVKDWGAWVVVDRDALSAYWISHIALKYRWPIYYWNYRSLRDISSVLPLHGAVNDAPGGGNYRLRICEGCAVLTPQRQDPRVREEVWVCDVCVRREAGLLELLNRPMVEELEPLDALLMVESKFLKDAERKALPLALAAGAALLSVDRDTSLEPVWGNVAAGGKISYQAALGFVYSLINLLPPGKPIVVAEMARRLYDRYLIPEGLAFDRWKRDFAQACGVAYTRGHLSKVDKGIYLPKK